MSNIQIGGMNTHLLGEYMESVLPLGSEEMEIDNTLSAIKTEAQLSEEEIPADISSELRDHESIKKIEGDKKKKGTFVKFIDRLVNGKITLTKKKDDNLFKITRDHGDEIEMNFRVLLRISLTNTNIVSIRVGYRTKSAEAIMNRLNLSGIIALNVLNIFKLLSRLVDNSADGCGGLGRKCFYLGELFPVFNEITLNMIRKGFQPIGQLNMSNEFAYMTFHKQPEAVRSGSPAPAYNVPGGNDRHAGGGIKKIKKRSKKKRQSNH